MITKKEIIIEGIKKMIAAFGVAPGVQALFIGPLIGHIRNAPDSQMDEAARIINETSAKLTQLKPEGNMNAEQIEKMLQDHEARIKTLESPKSEAPESAPVEQPNAD